MSTHFARELAEQPAHLLRLLSRRAEFESLGEIIRAFAPRFVVTAARGSSGNAARYAQALLGAHNRLVVGLGTPSLLTLYQSPPNLREALVLGISQSGESPDVTALVAEGRRQGALTVAITNAPRSPMARAAAHQLALELGPELAIAATKSYTAQLAAVAMLSTAIGDPTNDSSTAARWDALANLPAAAERTLEMCATLGLQEPVRSLASSDRAFILGRGFNLCTAFELALKLKETGYIAAEAFATPDFLHGPIAMVDAGVPGIVVAPRGPTLIDLAPLLEELEARHVPLIILSNGPSNGLSNELADPAFARLRSLRAPVVSFSDAVPEWLSPVVSVLPGQLIACAVSTARGHDPDHPRGLAKITKTH